MGNERPAQNSSIALLAAVEGAYAFYRWENVAINVWASQPTGQAVEVLHRLTERSLSDCPRGLASIHWLDEGIGLPTVEARQGLGLLAKQFDKHILCVAVLLSGDGFWASAIRSALSGIVMLAPRSYALRFYGDLPELSGFVAKELRRRTTQAVDPERILGAVNGALSGFSQV